jgi:hypothetical protein
MKKIKSLDISDTDIYSGLEYLSQDIECFKFSTNKKRYANRVIYNLFANEKGEVEVD